MRGGLGNEGALNSTSFAALMDAGLTPITNSFFIFIRRQRNPRKVERIWINKYTCTWRPTHTRSHLANNNTAGKKVKERKETPPVHPPTHLCSAMVLDLAINCFGNQLSEKLIYCLFSVYCAPQNEI